MAKNQPNDLEALRQRLGNLHEEINALNRSHDAKSVRVKRLRSSIAWFGVLLLVLIAGFLYLTASSYREFMDLKLKNDLLESRLGSDKPEDLSGLLQEIHRQPLPDKANYQPRILTKTERSQPLEFQVCKIVQTLLRAETVAPTDNLRNDLHATSMELFNVLLAVEWDCYVTLDNRTVDSIQTVQDLIDAVAVEQAKGSQ